MADDENALARLMAEELRSHAQVGVGPLDALTGRLAQDPQALAQLERARQAMRRVTHVADLLQQSAEAPRATPDGVDLSELTARVVAGFAGAFGDGTPSLDAPGEACVVDGEPKTWERILADLLTHLAVHQRQPSLTLRREADAIALSFAWPSEGPEPRSADLATALLLARRAGADVELAPGALTLRAPASDAPRHSVPPAPAQPLTSSLAREFATVAREWHGPRSEPPAGVTDSLAGAERGRVLLVDDDDEMREYISFVLGHGGYVVDEAHGGEQAWASIQRSPPDVVVADVVMTPVSGLTLLRRVRQTPGLATLPFVLISARTDEETRLEAVEAGADDFLVKPFSSRALSSRVGRALENARLRARAQRLVYDLFDQAPVPIAVIRGADLVFEMANPLYGVLTGRRELVGKPLLEAMPELVGQGFDALLREVMATGEPFVGRDMPVELVRERGGAPETTYWTFVYAPLSTDEGSVDRVMAFCHEVTDQVRARQASEASAAAATEAAQRKDEYLAMLAHELRNPVASISNATSLLESLVTDQPEPRRPLQIVRRQLDAITHLVDDLLDVSRVTRGLIELRNEPVALQDVVQAALVTAQPLLEASRMRVVSELPAAPAWVDGDALRLEQCVVNLLSNAAKYSPPGRRIWIGVEPGAAEHALSVRDEGVGMSEALTGRIFDIFEQGERTLDRPQSGLGLGLTIVRTLVQLHRGHVDVESEVGVGSTFTLRFPRGEAGARAPSLAPESETQRPLRVLVVDDLEDAAEMLAALLRREGHDVKVAFDGHAALDALTNDTFDIAFVDIGLPGKDGYEIARETRRAGRDLFLVALTGYGMARDVERALDAGFDRHVVKPMSRAQLRDALAAVSP